MNKSNVIRHLREAKEELDRTISKLQDDLSYGEDDLQAGMSHLYHHLNTAWNGRHATADEHRDITQDQFDSWRKFPTLNEMMLD